MAIVDDRFVAWPCWTSTWVRRPEAHGGTKICATSAQCIESYESSEYCHGCPRTVAAVQVDCLWHVLVGKLKDRLHIHIYHAVGRSVELNMALHGHGALGAICVYRHIGTAGQRVHQPPHLCHWCIYMHGIAIIYAWKHLMHDMCTHETSQYHCHTGPGGWGEVGLDGKVP